jgi:hypothetical protein
MSFRSASRSMAVTDWVMVCPSRLSPGGMSHSRERRGPGRVGVEAKGRRSRCRGDLRRGAYRMGHPLMRCRVRG